MKHAMIVRMELAVKRAEKTLAELRARRDALNDEIESAEDDLTKAKYDLSLNQELDQRQTARC